MQRPWYRRLVLLLTVVLAVAPLGGLQAAWAMEHGGHAGMQQAAAQDADRCDGDHCGQSAGCSDDGCHQGGCHHCSPGSVAFPAFTPPATALADHVRWRSPGHGRANWHHSPAYRPPRG